jgi:hypothetical protein
VSLAKTILAAALRFALKNHVEVNDLEVWISPEQRAELVNAAPEPLDVPNVKIDLSIRILEPWALKPGTFFICLKNPKPTTPDPRTIN